MKTDLPDELDNYLRGDTALSRQYKRESAPVPPHSLDRRVLRSVGEAHGKPPYLAPLAFAASVLLSVALVLAIAFGPQVARHTDDRPHVVRAAARSERPTSVPRGQEPWLYSSDPPRTNESPRARVPSVWLADIAALRRQGRNSEADAEFHRFRSVYPDYATDGLAARP